MILVLIGWICWNIGCNRLFGWRRCGARVCCGWLWFDGRFVVRALVRALVWLLIAFIGGYCGVNSVVQFLFFLLFRYDGACSFELGFDGCGLVAYVV